MSTSKAKQCIATQAILTKYSIEELIRLQIEEQVSERAVRAYGTHPASVRLERTFHLHSEVDEASRREQHHAPSGVASLSPIILSRRSRWSRQSQAHHESSDSGSLFASVSADPLVGGDLG